MAEDKFLYSFYCLYTVICDFERRSTKSLTIQLLNQIPDKSRCRVGHSFLEEGKILPVSDFSTRAILYNTMVRWLKYAIVRCPGYHSK